MCVRVYVCATTHTCGVHSYALHPHSNTCVDAACLADAACSLGCIQLSTVLFVGSLIFKLNDQVKLYEALQPGKVVFVFGGWRGEGGRGGVEGGG